MEYIYYSNERGNIFALFADEYLKFYDKDPPSKFCCNLEYLLFAHQILGICSSANCTICEEIHSATKEAILKGSCTDDLKQSSTQNMYFVSRERMKYYKNGTNTLYPGLFCSLIRDGAYQSSFVLFHFITKTKNERLKAVKVGLIGIVKHQ